MNILILVCYSVLLSTTNMAARYAIACHRVERVNMWQCLGGEGGSQDCLVSSNPLMKDCLVSSNPLMKDCLVSSNPLMMNAFR